MEVLLNWCLHLRGFSPSLSSGARLKTAEDGLLSIRDTKRTREYPLAKKSGGVLYNWVLITIRQLMQYFKNSHQWSKKTYAYFFSRYTSRNDFLRLIFITFNPCYVCKMSLLCRHYARCSTYSIMLEIMPA